MNEFDRTMSLLSDFELYEIIHHKRDSYTSDALTAAENIYASRTITPEHIADFKAKIQAQQSDRNTLIKDISELKSVFNFSSKWTLSKSMILVFILLIGIFLYYFIKNSSYITSIISDYKHWGLSGVFMIIPYIVFPIGLYGIWRYKKYGWYSIISVLIYFVYISAYAIVEGIKYYYGDDTSAYHIEDLFPKPMITSLVFKVVILVGIMIFFYRKNVLAIFTIKKIRGILFLVLISILMTILMISIPHY